MTYATLMVHLEAGRANAGLLKIAGTLAERFHAAVIGIAACQPVPIVFGDGSVSGDVVQQDRDEIEQEVKAAEVEFHAALANRVRNLEWRSAVVYGSLTDYVAHEARSADLVVTGVERGGSLFDPSRHVNVGDLVMQIGRPVLIAPTAVEELKVERVLVGWKDTRETRRAIYDALPLLKKAAHVTVVEIAAEEDLPAAREHLDDVVGWLKRHDIVAESLASLSTRDDASRLSAIAEEQGAGLIVAGAYGHSRLREWVLGGVTRDLLLQANRCSLVSH